MPQETLVCLPDISEQVVDGNIWIDFLLPNGIFLPLKVDFLAPLDLLKQIVWQNAQQYPLFERLKGRDCYCFEYLSRNGEREEVFDESLRLSEISPICRFLRFTERVNEELQKAATATVDYQLTNLIGSRTLMEISAMPRDEVEDFRRRMTQFTDNIARRTSADFETQFKKQYPLQLRTRSSDRLPEHLNEKLSKGLMVLSVRVKENSSKFNIRVDALDGPEAVVDAALRKWHNHSIRNSFDYILKVVGMEDYMYGKAPLHQFKYIYNCLQRNKAPEFWLINRNTVLSHTVPGPSPNWAPPRPHKSIRHKPDVMVWDVEDSFQLTVKTIKNIEITSDQVKDNIDKVKLFVGLYHGIEVLGGVQKTSELSVQGGTCSMDMTMTFDLAVMDVQPTSRLCFALHGKMKGAKSLNPIAWVNIPVFDFRSRLLMGEHRLPMWPVTAVLQLEDTGCYPLGVVSLNPHNTITLTIHFADYSRHPPLVYPQDDEVTQCAADSMAQEQPGIEGSADWRATQSQVDQLKLILDKQNISDDLHENDKDLIWMLRYECRDDFSHGLPLVLKSVKWNSHIDVAKMQVLLATWKQTIPVDNALELLDFNFPDKNVRKYAVDCLQQLCDDEVSLYLLQLVQALKYETYLYCPLAEFLLERALNNQHIGHQLFWLLKSELHNPLVTARYGLLMESYLKANTTHLSLLHRQFEGLNKLNAVSLLVKAGRVKDDKAKDTAKANMHTVLQQQSYMDKLSGIYSPLSPLYKLKELSVSQCKFMDSKKRPLYLVWSNDDEDAPEIHIIYKNGDDLRQDMLTLQMLQVMDSIWQSEGLDLRMNVYGCISSGLEQGMIEVVRHASTIANIQKHAKTAISKRTLFDWLKEKNGSDKELDQAIEEFTLSCAGYIVATYVLGIGDRHNDNIMLKETGQIFHIDFGHFLGNFKSKYGIRRERVPFVLTSHFAYIITKGDTKVENYKRFEQYCVDAYLALRKRGTLLVRLFMMMLSSGIPQLTNISDLDYLKDTLALHLSDEEASKHFRNKLREVLKSISTIINWIFHNMAH